MEPITPVVLPRRARNSVKTSAWGEISVSALGAMSGLGASPAAHAAAPEAIPAKNSAVMDARTVSAKIPLGTQPAPVKGAIPVVPVATQRAQASRDDTPADQFVLPEPGIPLALLAVFLVMLLIGRRRAHKALRIVSGSR